MSTRQVARDHGLSETAIRKRARAEYWLRRDVSDAGGVAVRSGFSDGIVGHHRRERPRPGKPIRQLRRELPAIEREYARKVDIQDLIEATTRAAEALLREIVEVIDKRKKLIKVIEATEQPSARVSRQHRLLVKEFDLKTLSTTLRNVLGIIEDLTRLEQRRKN